MVVELSSFAGLHLTQMGAEHAALVPLVMSLRADGYAITIVLYAISSLAFTTLLARSRYVPRALPLFGIVAMAGVLVATLLAIAFPGDFTQGLAAAASGGAMLFQIAIGAWLATRGVLRPRPRRPVAFGDLDGPG